MNIAGSLIQGCLFLFSTKSFWGCQQLNNYELQIRLYACSPRCAPGYRFHPAALELKILLWAK
jgi:hypothetical protein